MSGLRRHTASSLLLISLTSLTSCGDEVIGVRFALTPDANKNSEQMLLKRLGTLELVLDAPTGLYSKVDADAHPELIKDVDGDGAYEQVMTVKLEDELPKIMVHRGGLAGDEDLQLRIYGFAANANTAGGDAEEIARGEYEHFTMPSSGIEEKVVYFNIDADWLPPRIKQAYPPNGARNLKSVPFAEASFSVAMDKDSLLRSGTVQLLRFEGGNTVSVAGKDDGPYLRTEQGSSDITGVRFEPKEPLQAGSYQFRINTSALSENLVSLDHLPSKEGDQSFVSVFTISTELAATNTPSDKQVDLDNCTADGPACPEGFTCHRLAKRCVPAICTCSESYVCTPDLDCVEDCRTATTCPGAAECDPNTGLCK